MSSAPPISPIDALEALLAWLDRWRRDHDDGPLWAGGPSASEYALGLPRPTGSYVEEVRSLDELRTFFESLPPLEEITEAVPTEAHLPDHRYWRGPIPAAFTAWEAALPLSELDDTALFAVRVARGPHGLELRAVDIPARRTSEVVLITTEGRLVTWFPGRVGAPVDLGRAVVKLARRGGDVAVEG